MGVEVGLDTNARKNRSGHIFEAVVGDLLDEEFKNKDNIRIVKEDSSLNIDRIKRFDYVIYVDNRPKYAIECNFYAGTGSKPIEVAHAYAKLQKDLDEHDIKFIWVTDGFGWNKMSKTIKNVQEDIEYLVNYKMLVNHFNEIFDV